MTDKQVKITLTQELLDSLYTAAKDSGMDLATFLEQIIEMYSSAMDLSKQIK